MDAYFLSIIGERSLHRTVMIFLSLVKWVFLSCVERSQPRQSISEAIVRALLESITESHGSRLLWKTLRVHFNLFAHWHVLTPDYYLISPRMMLARAMFEDFNINETPPRHHRLGWNGILWSKMDWKKNLLFLITHVTIYCLRAWFRIR